MGDTKVILSNDGGVPIPGVGLLQTTEDDALFLDNIREIANLSKMRKEYNTIIHCRKGRILVEVGGNQQIKVRPGQLLLIPAGKVVQPIMVSTDVDAGVLLVSDKTLKTVLAGQINIWNKAMYMKEVYVINHQKWMDGFTCYVNSVFEQRDMQLRNEILLSFLRTMLLMICEGFMKHVDTPHVADTSTIRDKDIFGKFLTLIASEQYKHRQVSYYADKLCLTPKYLSIVCQRVSGKAPMQWITESTMEDCYLMLRDTNKTVKEISDSLGFPNSSFFGQFFRRQAGMTPLDYRTKYHKNV